MSDRSIHRDRSPARVAGDDLLVLAALADSAALKSLDLRDAAAAGMRDSTAKVISARHRGTVDDLAAAVIYFVMLA